jgi:DeoR family fructose operon transcriptional repressor
LTKPLIPAQRRQRIRDYLALHQVASNPDLSHLLRVSEATVRRDLEQLEIEGHLERTHGGAIVSQQLPVEPEYVNSAQSHPEEKFRIGQAAATLVRDGDTLFVNSGTTAAAFVRALPPGLRLTLITNNVSATLEAREAGTDLELILLGGAYRPRAKSVVGRFAAETLRQVYATKAIIGVDGLSLKHGCTTPASAEAEIARLMIERTRGDVIVIADHSKWGVVSNYAIAPLDSVTRLVSDDGLDPGARSQLAAHGVDVVIASKPRSNHQPHTD